MVRREFLLIVLSLVFAKSKRFAFKIKTKSGGIVSNIVITATDLDAAKAKLMKRYPGCTILSSKEK